MYSKGEGILHFPGGYGSMAQDVHIRELIKFTDYKRFGSSSKVFYNGQEVNNDGQQRNSAPGAKPDSSAPNAPPDSSAPQTPPGGGK